MTTRPVILLVLLLAVPVLAVASPRTDRTLDFVPGPAFDPDHGLVDSGESVQRFVPPPADLFDGIPLARRTARFTINYNPASCPAGTTTPWSTAAREAFSYAASIWAAILNGDETIEIDACWANNLASNVLGSAGPNGFWRNFDNAPVSNVFYPVALANQYDGSDLNGGDPEINARFNSNFTWYFGTDGNPPADRHDFVTVVLHEIGHGLGFAGTGNYDDGTGNAECGGVAGQGCIANPRYRYDQFVETLAGTRLTSLTSPSIAIGNAITSNDLFFDGTSANILNGGQRVELYAPAIWNRGSSYSHLGQGFNGTDDALMTFSISSGEAIHYPGLVTLGLFVDLGWDVRNLSTVYVDAGYTGSVETGGPTTPFDTFGEGVKAVEPGGTVIVRPGAYGESIEIFRAMFIRNDQAGSAVIGEQ